MKKYGFITNNLHTDLHECLGHGSGKLLPDTDPDALKAYSSTLEEARADLFGLYYLGDAKLVELGLVPDAEAYKAEYYKYIMNGLMTQLVRIEQGKNVEEAHMRNRQLIAKWVYEKGKADNVIELKQRMARHTWWSMTMPSCVNCSELCWRKCSVSRVKVIFPPERNWWKSMP